MREAAQCQLRANGVKMGELLVTRYAKGELRKKEILAATVDVICDEGISAVTHREVAKRANVAPSAPSYFFPSIEDLIVEAFESVMKIMIGDLDALTARIVEQNMDRETAVDAYIKLVREGAIKYDKLQYEAYLFAASRPRLRPAVEAAMSATHRHDNTLVAASRRDDLGWASTILTALVDGFGMYRVAAPGTANFQGLREGLLALMEALPGRPAKLDRSIKQQRAAATKARDPNSVSKKDSKKLKPQTGRS
jgi:DNA-binding transcriptional regulator YbjK